MEYDAISTSARVREWKHLTGRDFQEMDRANTVVVVSCSPLEVHGPHLPTITDNQEAEGLSLRMMEILSERHPTIEFVHLPPIFVACDVLPHAGSLQFKPSTCYAVARDMGRTLAKQGFRHIWMGSFHGGPRHFLGMEAAAHHVNRRYGTKMVSVLSTMLARLTEGQSDLSKVLAEVDGLDEDKLNGDTHGGVVETSMMLHLLGKHVDPKYRDLKRTTVDTRLADRGEPPLGHANLGQIIRGFKERLRYFAEVTYSGDPAAASPEIGEKTLDILAHLGADVMGDVWLGKIDPRDCHSPLWNKRWLFTIPAIGWAFEQMIGYDNAIF